MAADAVSTSGSDEIDATLLAATPDFLCFDVAMKATAAETEGDRFLYFEASNEDVDRQGEIILQKALSDSAAYYLAHGNIDISHRTMLPPRPGEPNPLEFEIGRPVDVQVSGTRTFVKAQLYQGDSAMARNANMVWDSLTKQRPQARFFASVGGSVLSKSVRIDPATKARVAVISGVRWSNTAVDRCPVNKTVPTISTAPIGVFAKSLGGFVVTKGLEAGYGTDVAALEGGAALRTQSLDTDLQSYWDFSERIARDIRKGACARDAGAIAARASGHYGLRADKATAWATRFVADVSEALALKQRKS